jgi:hypothetical protein
VFRGAGANAQIAEMEELSNKCRGAGAHSKVAEKEEQHR